MLVGRCRKFESERLANLGAAADDHWRIMGIHESIFTPDER
jgi:hypothetical protein